MAFHFCSAKASRAGLGFWPVFLIKLRAASRMAASACGADPERTRQWSSRNVTSRTWNRLFSIRQWSRESCSRPGCSDEGGIEAGNGVDHLARAAILQLADAL